LAGFCLAVASLWLCGIARGFGSSVLPSLVGARAKDSASTINRQDVSNQRIEVHPCAQHFGRFSLEPFDQFGIAFFVRAFSHQFAV
jgi:hypothetical protein